MTNICGSSSLSFFMILAYQGTSNNNTKKNIADRCRHAVVGIDLVAEFMSFAARRPKLCANESRNSSQVSNSQRLRSRHRIIVKDLGFIWIHNGLFAHRCSWKGAGA